METTKNRINELLGNYFKHKTEENFLEVYKETKDKYRKQLKGWVGSTFNFTTHDATQLFDDTLLKVLEAIETNGGDFEKLFHRSLYNRYKDRFRRQKFRASIETYDKDDETSLVKNLADKSDTEIEVIEKLSGKKKDDQRQLIDFFVHGENARTTAIVKAYLETDFKTPTAIGKYLGLDHKQVTRALTRLAAKYDSKQYGDYSDYLVAL